MSPVATYWCFLLVISVPLSAACSSVRDKEPTSDSLRVNVAPNAQTPRWNLSAEPMLTIGRDGDSLYEFHNPGTALSLSDGRIVVTNAHQEIRYYGSNGEFIQRVGRKGYGPGEFRQLSAITVLINDSIAAVNNHDGAFREIIIFDDRGNSVREFRADMRGPGLIRLQSGDWIGEIVERQRMSCKATPTEVRSELPIVRARPSGDVVQELARILAGFGLMVGCDYYNVPLSPQGSWTAGGGHLFTADDTGHVIHVRSIESGRILRTVTTDAPQRRVTQDMIDEALNPPSPGNLGVGRERSRTTRPDMRYPDVLPSIFSMQVDKDGNLWVRRYFLASDPEHEWWIYEPNGRLEATLKHPSQFRLTEIGSDYVLGLWRDQNDVQTIRRYSLLK